MADWIFLLSLQLFRAYDLDLSVELGSGDVILELVEEELVDPVDELALARHVLVRHLQHTFIKGTVT
jgi:hypothetical protein